MMPYTVYEHNNGVRNIRLQLDNPDTLSIILHDRPDADGLYMHVLVIAVYSLPHNEQDPTDPTMRYKITNIATASFVGLCNLL